MSDETKTAQHEVHIALIILLTCQISFVLTLADVAMVIPLREREVVSAGFEGFQPIS